MAHCLCWASWAPIGAEGTVGPRAAGAPPGSRVGSFPGTREHWGFAEEIKSPLERRAYQQRQHQKYTLSPELNSSIT